MADQLEHLFRPNSVAVIGASNSQGKVGYAVVRNLKESNFPGNIYPINPHEDKILGYDVYRSISELPEVADVAVMCVPAKIISALAREVGEAGTPYMITITAGFKEIGREGLAREQELLSTVEEYGIKMLGPNCLGLIDTHTPVNMTFATIQPLKGDIAFFSQSGALCVSILEWSRTQNLGFSKFVSLGNKAQLNEADFIADAAEDPYTQVILGYVESVEEGARFLDVAREASRKKPIILIKSGTSEAGAKAASSHTGALAGSDRAYETAFRQTGILRARSMQELFDLATTFAKQPEPHGRRVAIITNAGGPGIITTDNVDKYGLEMASLQRRTVDALHESLPAEANVFNPIDVLGDAGPDRYRFALERALEDLNVDAAITLLTPTAFTEPVATAEDILRVHAEHPEKPIAAAFMGGISADKAVEKLNNGGIPCYKFPEPAVASLAGLADYAEMRTRTATPLPHYDEADQNVVRMIFENVRDDNRLVLLGSEAATVADAYGINVAPLRLAHTPEDAVEIASELGYPVVLKVASPRIVHKTDVGGVLLNLQNDEQVHNGFVDILENVQRYVPDVLPHGVEVQKMVDPGKELIIGMSRDIQFGPLLMVGLGGIYVNLLEDVSFRLARGLTVEELESMIRETKAYTLLRGFRGDPPLDAKAVETALARVAQLALDFPELTELDINPLFVYTEGISALDVKMTIE